MRYVDDKHGAIAAVFGAPGQQVGNRGRETGSAEAVSADDL